MGRHPKAFIDALKSFISNDKKTIADSKTEMWKNITVTEGGVEIPRVANAKESLKRNTRYLEIAEKQNADDDKL